MEKLRAKLRRQGGFTLVEMLIVVAIIAILIAVSIPLVNGALEKARDATDQANERAAKAEALLYFTGTASDEELLAFGGGTTAYAPGTKLEGYYDGQEGKLVKSKDDIKEAYGQCTGGTNCYRGAPSHIGSVIKVTVETVGSVKIEWETLSP